jgi:hypothetical protein
MRCRPARRPGAKSTRFSIIPVVSCSHIHTISSRLQCNIADLPSYHLAAEYALWHHNILDIKENDQHGLELRNTHAYFFGFGNDDFHCIACRLVSG